MLVARVLTFPVPQEPFSAARECELRSLDAGKRLEGGAGGSPAIRTMAVERVREFVGDGVFDRAAQALATQSERARHVGQELARPWQESPIFPQSRREFAAPHPIGYAIARD